MEDILKITTEVLDEINYPYYIDEVKDFIYIEVENIIGKHVLQFDDDFIIPDGFLSRCIINGGLILPLKEVGDNFLKDSIVKGNLIMENLEDFGDNFLKDTILNYDINLPKLKSVGNAIKNRYINGSLILNSLEDFSELENIVVVGDLYIPNAHNFGLFYDVNSTYVVAGKVTTINETFQLENYSENELATFFDNYYKYNSNIIKQMINLRPFGVAVSKLIRDNTHFTDLVLVDLKNEEIPKSFFYNVTIWDKLIIENTPKTHNFEDVLINNIKLSNEGRIILDYEDVIDNDYINEYNQNLNIVEYNEDDNILLLKNINTYIYLDKVSEVQFYNNTMEVLYDCGKERRYIDRDNIKLYKKVFNKIYFK